MSYDPNINDPRDPYGSRDRGDRRDDLAEPRQNPAAAKGKLLAPGILLLLTGVLNLGMGGWWSYNGYMVANPTPEMKKAMDEAMEKQKREKPEDFKKLQEAGLSIESLMNVGSGVLIGLGVVNLLSGLLGLFGGIQMMQAKSYGLAMFASIVSMIPCVSGSFCCLIGPIAGIWALVVLFNSDVKVAFK